MMEVILFILAIPFIVMAYSILKGLVDPTHKAKIEKATKTYDRMSKEGFNDDYIFQTIDKESRGVLENQHFSPLDAGKWAVLNKKDGSLLLYKSDDRESVENYMKDIQANSLGDVDYKLIQIPGEKFSL